MPSNANPAQSLSPRAGLSSPHASLKHLPHLNALTQGLTEEFASVVVMHTHVEDYDGISGLTPTEEILRDEVIQRSQICALATTKETSSDRGPTLMPRRRDYTAMLAFADTFFLAAAVLYGMAYWPVIDALFR